MDALSIFGVLALIAILIVALSVIVTAVILTAQRDKLKYLDQTRMVRQVGSDTRREVDQMSDELLQEAERHFEQEKRRR